MAAEVAQLEHGLTRDVNSCTGEPPLATPTLTVSQQASPRPGRDARSRKKQKRKYAFIRGIMGTKGGSRNAEEGERGGAAEIIRSPRGHGRSWFAPKRARNRTDLAGRLPPFVNGCMCLQLYAVPSLPAPKHGSSSLFDVAATITSQLFSRG